MPQKQNKKKKNNGEKLMKETISIEDWEGLI